LNLKKKSFTIIEIVIVILILGILSAVALPGMFDLTSDAKNASDDYTIAAIFGLVNNLYMESALNSATSSYPTMTQIVNNLTQPIFYNGLTANEWSYIEVFGGNIIVLYCPHGITGVGRRYWVYFRIDFPPYGAGSIVEFGSGPH